MSMQRQIGQQQGIALITAFVLGLVALFGFAAWLRSRPREAPRAVEMAPVREEIVAGQREVAPSAPVGQMSDEAARRRELLESMKWNAQHQR